MRIRFTWLERRRARRGYDRQVWLRDVCTRFGYVPLNYTQVFRAHNLALTEVLAWGARP